MPTPWIACMNMKLSVIMLATICKGPVHANAWDCLDAACILVPASHIPFDLHWTGEHVRSRQRVPSASTRTTKSIRCSHRRQTRRQDEDLHHRRLLPHSPQCTILPPLRSIFRRIRALPSWPWPPSVIARVGGDTASTLGDQGSDHLHGVYRVRYAERY